jgi:thioesterase domain-containing protein/acyl carrier protein
MTQASLISDDHLHAELLEIWKTLLETDALTIDDDFFENGGDSLLATELVQHLERRFGVSVPDSLLFEASTIRRLAEIFSRSPEVQQKAVYQVSEAAEECPLFFFHGDWTNGGFYLKDFARSLGPEQPLVAVAPHGVKGERIPPSLEEMAVQRLPQILHFRPRGPFRLGGHCVGGMVALETARLLVASGHDVQVVAMIDPIWTGAGQPWPTLAGAVPKQFEFLLPSTSESWQQYEEALVSYIPAPLPVPILVFSSTFDGQPWQRTSEDFRLFQLPGGHFDLVTSRSGEFAAHLGDQMRRISDRARPPVFAAQLRAQLKRIAGQLRPRL